MFVFASESQISSVIFFICSPKKQKNWREHIKRSVRLLPSIQDYDKNKPISLLLLYFITPFCCFFQLFRNNIITYLCLWKDDLANPSSSILHQSLVLVYSNNNKAVIHTKDMSHSPIRQYVYCWSFLKFYLCKDERTK